MATPTYTALQTITLASTASSVTFSSIPGTYRDLVLVWDGQTSVTANTFWQVNGDTGSNYSYVQMFAYTATPASNSTTTTSGLAGANYQIRGVNTLQFMDYSATDKHKSVLVRSNSGNGQVAAIANRWANTTAVSSIRIFLASGTFAATTTFSLYGIH